MKRMLCISLIFICSFAGGSAQNAVAQIELFERRLEAEKERELETDRDAFTPATSTAGQGTAIFESSYSFIDNRSVAETHSFPEVLLRFGVSDRIELRLGWNYEVGGTGDVVSGSEVSEEAGSGIERESQVLYGLKASVTEQDDWLPRSAIILQGYTPTLGEAPATDVVAAYTFGWELPNRWRLDSSMRYATEHGADDTFNQWAPSVVVRVPLSEQWQVHAEYFSIISDGAEQDVVRSFFSPGAHCLLTENFELGVRVGWGVTENSPGFFSNVGIGWSF